MNSAGSTLIRRIYRDLLRSSAAAVRFSGPATKNSRRYLRDEIAHELQAIYAGSTHTHLHKLAHLTSAFHLASSLSPRTAAPHLAHQDQDDLAVKSDEQSLAGPSRTQLTLAHRIVANMSSLTYHHLSPHTQMQRLAHMRAKKSMRTPKSISAIARVLGKVKPDTPSDTDETEPSSIDADALDTMPHGSDAVINATHLQIDFLNPSMKPPRGPASLKLPIWDGQDYTKQETSAALALMQSDLNKIQDILDRLQKDRAADPRKLNKLRQEADELKSKIKGKGRRRQQLDKNAQFELIPIDMIANLIGAAQDSHQVWLGKQRWLVRQRNGFLPP